MSTFNRGLSETFVGALNEEYERGGWWRQIMDDRDIFIAIREDSVNAYYRGCSLLKLNWKGGTIVGETHYKYLLRPNLKNPYVKILNGKPNLEAIKGSLFLNSLGDTADLKKAAEPYAGDEKKGVHNIISANSNILDVEIAFGIGGTDESDPSAPRIDIAAIQLLDQSAKVVFFEAKHFRNDELRANNIEKIEVVKQIENYSVLIKSNSNAIVESYLRVCRNLVRVRGLEERSESLRDIASGSRKLFLDEMPVLVVFGFDADQRDGKNWKFHRDRLCEKLGKERVILKGRSKKLVRGISV